MVASDPSRCGMRQLCHVWVGCRRQPEGAHAMGFDQYHEPPDELPAATRTFARLCASLTEEAEAIGWYEQRLAVETDAEATAIMRDAQGEEFKHFSMDLEFLLRRTPLCVRSHGASCSRTATSSSTARRPRSRQSRVRPT